MANRYWVGVAGTWDASSITNWSTVSNGAGGASAPTSADAVIFDAYSPSCTTAAGATCASLSATSYAAVSVLTLGANLTMTGSCSFGQGILSLGTFTLTSSTFSSSVSTSRTLDFGTGNITVTGTGTVFNTTTSLGFAVAGTPIINVTSTGSTAITVSTGNSASSQQLSFNFSGGTYPLTLTSGRSNNLNFTGFSGSLLNTARIIYGGYTLSSTMTVSAGASTTTFAGTSGTQTITTNGVVCNHPFVFNGVGGTFALGSNLVGLTSGQTLTHTNGTLNLAGFTANCWTYTTATGTKNLTFNGGTLRCFGDSASVFNNAVPAGFTTTAGTGVGIIEMASTVSKAFAGGGSTFNCTLSHSGGQTQITGANTFTDITSAVSNTSGISFPSATTTTCTNFNVKGSVGFVQTITSPAGSQANLVITNKTSGLDYLDIYRINSVNKTPITFWAGANSLNSKNNTGIAFADGTSQQAYLLISGTSFTTPADWNNASNSIYMFGAGGGGSGSSIFIAAGGGGGGGGFRLLSNQTLSGAVSYAIGAGGTAGAAGLVTGTIVTAGTGGTTTWNTTNTATGGGGGSSRGTIPQANGGAGGVGTYSGGAGGTGSILGSDYTGGGGGGGSGGPLGAGGTGGAGAASNAAGGGGGGGGGNGGGTSGGDAVSGVSSGAGGNNASGSGGGAAQTLQGAGFPGTLGGGGSGAWIVSSATAGNAGGVGSADITIAGLPVSSGANGGAIGLFRAAASSLYGSGGGGSGGSNGTSISGIAGAQGAIVIVYSIGGTTYTGSVTEDSVLFDSSTKVLVFQSALSEDLTLNDTSTKVLVFQSALSEDLTLNDTSTKVLVFQSALSEDLTLNDTSTKVLVFQSTLLETLSSNDVIFPTGWFKVVNTQTDMWTAINSNQTTAWVDINDVQNPNWGSINNSQ